MHRTCPPTCMCPASDNPLVLQAKIRERARPKGHAGPKRARREKEGTAQEGTQGPRGHAGPKRARREKEGTAQEGTQGKRGHAGKKRAWPKRARRAQEGTKGAAPRTRVPFLSAHRGVRACIGLGDGDGGCQHPGLNKGWCAHATHLGRNTEREPALLANFPNHGDDHGLNGAACIARMCVQYLGH